MLIDSHCHLDFPAFDADREQVIAHCRAVGVVGIVVPGVSAATWPRLLGLVAQHPGFLHAALGLQPLFLAEHEEAHVDALREAVLRHRPVAIGEIGLDHYRQELDRARQRALFLAQLEVAREAALPVILHVRKAHEDVLQILRGVGLSAGGVVHAFNGSAEQARRYIDLGFKLGVGGAMTHERARRLRDMVRVLPASALVLETDAPDMAPAGHRGERNSPAHLPEVLAALAALREEPAAALARTCLHNTQALFGLECP